MAFDMKHDWPILAAGGLGIGAVIMLMGSGGGGSSTSSSSSADAGLSSAMATELAQQNQTAGQLQLAQIQANAQQQQNASQVIGSVIGDVLNQQSNQQNLSEEVQLAQIQAGSTSQANDLQAQLSEYEAYLGSLGTEFGDTTNLQLGTTQSNDQLAAVEAQVASEQQIADEEAALRAGLSPSGGLNFNSLVGDIPILGGLI